LGARNGFVAVAVVDLKYQDVAGVTMHGLRDVDGKGRFTASCEATSSPFGETRQRSLTLAKSSRGRGHFTLLHVEIGGTPCGAGLLVAQIAVGMGVLYGDEVPVSPRLFSPRSASDWALRRPRRAAGN
jgi:hypothetical protein